MLHAISRCPVSFAPAVPSLENAQVRPNVEWWEAAGTRYNSTDELIHGFKPNQDGTTQAGVYHWRQEITPPAAPNLLWTTAKSAAMGALVGTCGVAFAGVPTASWGPWMASFAVVGAVGFAALNVLQAKDDAREAAQHYQNGTLVDGRLATEASPDGQHVVFYVEGDVDHKIDLNRYSTSQPGPVDEHNPPWWERYGHW